MAVDQEIRVLGDENIIANPKNSQKSYPLTFKAQTNVIVYGRKKENLNFTVPISSEVNYNFNLERNTIIFSDNFNLEEYSYILVKNPFEDISDFFQISSLEELSPDGEEFNKFNDEVVKWLRRITEILSDRCMIFETTLFKDINNFPNIPVGHVFIRAKDGWTSTTITDADKSLKKLISEYTELMKKEITKHVTVTEIPRITEHADKEIERIIVQGNEEIGLIQDFTDKKKVEITQHTDEEIGRINLTGIGNKLSKADTIAELKAMNLKLNDVVEVLGYYSKDDGATHKRVIANEDDGGGVQLANGLWANIVHNGEVNVSWFGKDYNKLFNNIDKYSYVYFDKVINIKTDEKIVFNLSSDRNLTIDFNNSKISTISKMLSSSTRGAYIHFDNKSQSNKNVFIKNLIIDMSSIEKNYQAIKSGIPYNYQFALLFNNINIELENIKHLNGISCTTIRVEGGESLKINNLYSEVFGRKPGTFSTAQTDVIYIFKVKNHSFIGNNIIHKIDPILVSDNQEIVAMKKSRAFMVYEYSDEKNCYRECQLNNIYSEGAERFIHNEFSTNFHIKINNYFIKDTQHLFFGHQLDTNNSFIIFDSGVIEYNFIQEKFHNKTRGLFYQELYKAGETLFLNCFLKNTKLENKTKDVYLNLQRECNLILENNTFFNICPFPFDKGLDNFTCFMSNCEFKFSEYSTNIYPQFDCEKLTMMNCKFINTCMAVNGGLDNSSQLINTLIADSCEIDLTNIPELSSLVDFWENSNRKRNTFIHNCLWKISSDTIVSNNAINKISYASWGGNLILQGDTIKNFVINNVDQSDVSQLNTPYMAMKMQQEGVYGDFVDYMDSKIAYDKQQEKLERDKRIAYEEYLQRHPDASYEDFLGEIDYLDSYKISFVRYEEPEPSEKLKAFMDKWL